MRSGPCGPGWGWSRPWRTLNARRLEQGHGSAGLAVRVGIHTGLVVVGEMGGGSRQEQLALGETPNIAARLQGLAAPDTVVVSAATFRLVRGYFTCQELGTHTPQGGDSAAPGVSHAGGECGPEPPGCRRPERSHAPGGAREEVVLLLERWAQSQDGRGQVVLLSGEAGIGKSRLVQVLKERVAARAPCAMVFRCSPYHQHSALYPVIEHLQRVLHWRPGGCS